MLTFPIKYTQTLLHAKLFNGWLHISMKTVFCMYLLTALQSFINLFKFISKCSKHSGEQKGKIAHWRMADALVLQDVIFRSFCSYLRGFCHLQKPPRPGRQIDWRASGSSRPDESLTLIRHFFWGTFIKQASPVQDKICKDHSLRDDWIHICTYNTTTTVLIL